MARMPFGLNKATFRLAFPVHFGLKPGEAEGGSGHFGLSVLAPFAHDLGPLIRNAQSSHN